MLNVDEISLIGFKSINQSKFRMQILFQSTALKNRNLNTHPAIRWKTFPFCSFVWLQWTELLPQYTFEIWYPSPHLLLQELNCALCSLLPYYSRSVPHSAQFRQPALCATECTVYSVHKTPCMKRTNVIYDSLALLFMVFWKSYNEPSEKPNGNKNTKQSTSNVTVTAAWNADFIFSAEINSFFPAKSKSKTKKQLVLLTSLVISCSMFANSLVLNRTESCGFSSLSWFNVTFTVMHAIRIAVFVLHCIKSVSGHKWTYCLLARAPMTAAEYALAPAPVVLCGLFSSLETVAYNNKWSVLIPFSGGSDRKRFLHLFFPVADIECSTDRAINCLLSYTLRFQCSDIADLISIFHSLQTETETETELNVCECKQCGVCLLVCDIMPTFLLFASILFTEFLALVSLKYTLRYDVDDVSLTMNHSKCVPYWEASNKEEKNHTWKTDHFAADECKLRLQKSTISNLWAIAHFGF